MHILKVAAKTPTMKISVCGTEKVENWSEFAKKKKKSTEPTKSGERVRKLRVSHFEE